MKKKENKENKLLTSPDHAHKANTYFPIEITNLKRGTSIPMLAISQHWNFP